MSGPAGAAYARARDVFEALYQTPAGPERAERLAALCDGDDALRADVESLLAAHESRGSFLGRPAVPHFGDPETVPEPLAPGTRIGGFTVIRFIGSGGMGMVYEAEQEGLHRRVALKTLRQGLGSPGAKRRFRREAALLARLEHPCLARVIDSGVLEPAAGEPDSEALPWFAMEFVDGPAITEFAERNGLTVAQRLELLARVCDAVQHAHDRGVIHRDIKPGNVLVGADGTPKLVDFGVARATGLDAGATLAGCTVTGQVVGTLAYMSPEQAEGRTGGVDERTDVYALGALGYELLTGRQPVDTSGALPLDAAVAVRERLPRRMRSIDRSLRDPEPTIFKALEKDPERRWASAAAMAADLRRVARGEPSVAEPVRLWRQVRALAAQNRRAAIAAVVALAAILAAIGGTTWQAVRATRAQRAEVARSEELRALSRSLVFELYDAIRSIPGATRARELLVRRAVEQLESLAAGSAGDERLTQDLAEAYLRLGEISANAIEGTLGATAEGQKLYAHAEELWGRLARAHPDDPAIHRSLLRAMFLRRDAHATSRADDADVEGRLGLVYSLQERFVSEHPDDPEALVDLAETLRRMAMGVARYRSWPEGKEMLLRGLATCDAALAIEPTLVRARVEHARNELDTAIAALGGGDSPEQVADRSRRALAEFEALAASDPHSADSRGWITRVHGVLAVALSRSGRFDEAWGHLETCLSMAVALATVDTSDANAHRRVLTACWQGAEIQDQWADQSGLAVPDRLAHLRAALEYTDRYAVLLRERTDRGWLTPVESDYAEECAQMLTRRRSRLAQGASDLVAAAGPVAGW